MHPQAEVAQVAAEVGLLRVGTVLVTRQDEFDGGDQLAVKIDVYGRLRVEAYGNAHFQVRYEGGGIDRHPLGRRLRPPFPDADVGLAVARGHR